MARAHAHRRSRAPPSPSPATRLRTQAIPIRWHNSLAAPEVETVQVTYSCAVYTALVHSCEHPSNTSTIVKSEISDGDRRRVPFRCARGRLARDGVVDAATAGAGRRCCTIRPSWASANCSVCVGAVLLRDEAAGHRATMWAREGTGPIQSVSQGGREGSPHRP